jgi:alpha-acetolactate decarboxylase
MAHSDTTGPNYYRRGTIQTWDFIRDQGLNFHLGNAIKYICRAGYKDSRAEDLKKAIHYLQNELENTVIQAATSKGIQEKFPGEEQYYASFTDYAEAFDR